MHSSISSSNSLERVIPKQDWHKLAICSFIFSLLLTVGWELYWRSKGYAPTRNDNKDAWALNRIKVEQNPKATVLIGASRMLFNFNLSTWRDAKGDLPIQLATVGTNASVYLDDLANNSNFSGTLLVGIVPPLFFVPEGMPIDLPTGNVKYFKTFSPARKFSYYLSLPLEDNLAFFEQEDIPLEKILKRLPIQNRQGASLPPVLPPYFMEMDSNRQGMMTLKAQNDPDLQKLIQNRWVPLFTPPPPPPIFTHEQFMKIFADHVNNVLKTTKENIAKIQARGGKVILIRYPSSGRVRELENQFAPRAAFWDRIVNETGANQTIHFEDYDQLKKFTCPEWSHLTREDAVLYTKELIQLIK